MLRGRHLTRCVVVSGSIDAARPYGTRVISVRDTSLVAARIIAPLPGPLLPHALRCSVHTAARGSPGNPPVTRERYRHPALLRDYRLWPRFPITMSPAVTTGNHAAIAHQLAFVKWWMEVDYSSTLPNGSVPLGRDATPMDSLEPRIAEGMQRWNTFAGGLQSAGRAGSASPLDRLHPSSQSRLLIRGTCVGGPLARIVRPDASFEDVPPLHCHVC